MKQYSAERKEALLWQMMPPQNRLMSEQTLYTRRRQLRNQGKPVPGSGKECQGMDLGRQLRRGVEDGYSERKRTGGILPTQGFVPEQIATWRAAIKGQYYC